MDMPGSNQGLNVGKILFRGGADITSGRAGTVSKVITRRWMISGLGMALVAGCTTGSPDDGTRIISAAEANGIRTQHVDTLNAFRSSRGLKPVRLSARLVAAAATHARDMSVQRRAWHFGSDGTSPADRAARAGYAGRVVGENISESFDDEVTLFQSWVDDPVTRQVMSDPAADHVGLAWHQESNGKIWWVQMLGDSASVPQAAGS